MRRYTTLTSTTSHIAGISYQKSLSEDQGVREMTRLAPCLRSGASLALNPVWLQVE